MQSTPPLAKLFTPATKGTETWVGKSGTAMWPMGGGELWRWSGMATPESPSNRGMMKRHTGGRQLQRLGRRKKRCKTIMGIARLNEKPSRRLAGAWASFPVLLFLQVTLQCSTPLTVRPSKSTLKRSRFNHNPSPSPLSSLKTNLPLSIPRLGN